MEINAGIASLNHVKPIWMVMGWGGKGGGSGKGRASSVPSTLGRLQCYFSSFRPGWSAGSPGQHLHPLTQAASSRADEDPSLADGGGLGNAL